ncbi:hypothetical protein [Thalassospira lohafexi]|uniref:Up-regulated in Daf-2 domain-containing protein n=1 Tax=Thalassospira lohafexi TaxID=744227 RepID=A0A2N3L4L2_9PROT|nr:hypothetical protein [Thalassospira lohafexi]PKR57637.1 hypothetical protein COO92_12700 [Thalassospira lohafexi]
MLKFVATSIFFLVFGVFMVPAEAGDFSNVHVGTATDYQAISATQLALKSTDSEKTTVAETLSNSRELSIQNAYNGVGNTELLVTKFWHKGGTSSLDSTWQHITVEVWKNDEYVKTCHAYSLDVEIGKGDNRRRVYQSTCD